MGHKLTSRAQRVGGLSLSALFTSGTILLFYSANISTTYRYPSESIIGYDRTKAVLRVGADLGVQTWLAFLGVGFGLFSFGLSGTYTHMFDLWCSFRSTRTSGLDYARYLNSQPHAPVLVGFRGFPVSVVLRYMVLALGLLATVGYPFAVVEIVLENHQHVHESLVPLRVPDMRAVLENGTTSPWLGDGPLMYGNRAFLHQVQTVPIDSQNETDEDETSQPPTRIVMVGWADCGDVFDVHDEGMLYTREIVMIANLTEEQDGDAFMGADHPGWLRGATPSPNWATNKTQGAVIDYRISQPGKVEIQWAENGTWVNDSSLNQPVVQKLTYNIHFAVAVVQRLVSGGSCSEISRQDGALSALRIVVNTTIPVNTDRYIEPLQQYKYWIDATLLDNQSNPLNGVSGLLRSIMAEWGLQLSEQQNSTTIHLGHAPKNPPPRPANYTESQWFNETDYKDSLTPFVSVTWPIWNHTKFTTTPIKVNSSNNIAVRYPVYSGTRTTGQAGSYYTVTYIFSALGFFAYFIIFVRMVLGPAELTSWMGQHVYLALAGKTPKHWDIDRLACGYRAARDLGMLGIEARPRSPPEFPAGVWKFGGGVNIGVL